MKKLLLCLAIFASVSCYSQTKVADETEMIPSGKSNFVVKTSNDSIFGKLRQAHENKFLRYTVTYKKDRLGKYRVYSVYMKNEDATPIFNYLKAL